MGNDGEAVRYLPQVIHWKALIRDMRPALLPCGWHSALHQSELLGRVLGKDAAAYCLGLDA